MRWALAPLVAVAVAVAGCGGSSAGGSGPTVRVAAASSLEKALTDCLPSVSGLRARLETGGSDELAARIRAGVRPDVFAAANLALPQRLAHDGLVDAPVAFATNQLVLAVPSGSPLGALGDLAHGSPTIAIGSATVPVGIYTRKVLGGLPPDERIAILSHVRSQEPDVKGIVGKLLAGAVQAGFVYRSDVQAAGGKLRAIALPASLHPTATYGVAIVRGAAPAARRVVADLLRGGCAATLRHDGFGPPPR